MTPDQLHFRSPRIGWFPWAWQDWHAGEGLKSCHNSDKQLRSVHPPSEHRHDGMSPPAPRPRQPALCSPLLGIGITSLSPCCKRGLLPFRSLPQVYVLQHTCSAWQRAAASVLFQYRLTHPSTLGVTCWLAAIRKSMQRRLCDPWSTCFPQPCPLQHGSLLRGYPPPPPSLMLQTHTGTFSLVLAMIQHPPSLRACCRVTLLVRKANVWAGLGVKFILGFA